MKKIILMIAAVIMIFVSCGCAGMKYNRHLVIENGKSSVVLSPGEKTRLNVTCPVTGLPVYKDLRFYSSNIFVASVDRSGIVHAGVCGKSRITVTDSSGRTASILIIVQGKDKAAFLFLICAAAVIAAVSVIFFFKKCRKARF